MGIRRHLAGVAAWAGRLAVGALWAGFPASCNPPPASAPAKPVTATTATGALTDPSWLLAEMTRLESRGLQAQKDVDHAELTRAAEAVEALPLVEPHNLRRRDELAKQLRIQAAVARSDLHRFLFAELEDLPQEQRKGLLDAGDRGDRDALQRAGAALAQKEFKAQRRYLRAAFGLKPGATDPITKLPIRAAGDATLGWQGKLNEAFNVTMRALVAAQTPATR